MSKLPARPRAAENGPAPAMPSGGPWVPVVDGAMRDACLQAIAAIAHDVWPSMLAMPGAHHLAGGEAGAALFYAYLAEAGEPGLDDEAERRATELLERSLAGRATPEPALWGTAVGRAWTLTHLVDVDEDDPADAVDTALLDVLSSRWESEIGIIYGLGGVGLYFIERLPRLAARRGVELVVERLDELAEEGPEGVAWFTPPELVAQPFTVGEDGRIVFLARTPGEELPHGYYNLGLGRGMTGVLPFLAMTTALDVPVAHRARRLLDGAVRWLLARRIGVDPPVFPAYIAPGRDPRVGPFAWGSGDPGVAAAIFLAGRISAVPDWEAVALDVARAGARLQPEQTTVASARVDTGAAGVAHVYNRLYRATGDPVLGDAARAWVARTLEFLPQLELASLDGAAGAGLALLAAATTVEPAWDILLGLSAPRGVGA